MRKAIFHHHAGRISGAADFQNECLLPQRQERMDRRVRSGEILVGRERENRFDSLIKSDNGVLFGQLSVRVGIGTAERQLRVPTHSRLLCLSGLHGYPEVTAQRAERSFADIAPQKLMKALLSDSRVEQYLKVDANETSSTSSTTRRIWISVGRPTKSCYARSIG